MPQDRQFQMPRRTPEHPPLGAEGGENDLFNDALSGALELSSLNRSTPIEFMEIAFDAMDKYGLELNDYRVVAILKRALGSRQEALDRISGLSEEAFGQTYPGAYGDLVRWYIEPPSEK